MAVIATAGSSRTYTPLPSGSHVARCYSIVDLGSHDDTYQGETRKRHTVRIGWEVPGERIDVGGEDKPASISKTYTLSLNEKAGLRKELEGWRGRAFTADELRGFDLAKLIGQECLLSVIHETKQDGKVVAKITSISRLPKGMSCPAAENKTLEYSVSTHRQEVFETLPQFLQDIIRESDEWKAAIKAAATSEDAPEATETNDDVPF
jgi:hypothetical protein